MKASVVSVILGSLLCASAVLFSGPIMAGYWVEYGLDGGQAIIIHSNPGSNTMMETWVWIYFSISLLVLITGIYALFKKMQLLRKWLAYIQLILGVLVVVSLAVYILFVEPDWSPYFRNMEYTGHQILIKHGAT